MANITSDVRTVTIDLGIDIVVAESMFLGRLPQRKVADTVVVTIDGDNVTVVSPTRHETDESYGGTVPGKGWRHYYRDSTFSIDLSEHEQIREIVASVI